MKKLLIALSFFISLSCPTAFGQTLIPIPDTLSGTSFYLTIEDSVTQFYPGFSTNTIGYNGSYLGPTLILNQNDIVELMVVNQLADTTTTHWHGLHVHPMHDGGPHSLILPSETWMAHFKVMDKAATYWYHPHPHGKTMEQVVKGAAGLIIVRDSEEAALTLPRTYGVDDIPLIFQFQTFDTLTKQIIVNDEFDNAVLVNGTINGMVNAPAQMVRLRLLNASSMRFFRFGFDNNRTFHQITSDAGLLDAPVALSRLDLSPGERAEILVDFSGEQGDTLFLKTYASEFPTGYPGGEMMMGMQLGPLDDIDFNVLQINVTAPTSNPVTTIPSALTTNTVWDETGVSQRFLDLTAQPMMSMSNFFINGAQFDMEVVNFSVQQESVEIWNIENLTFVAHPFHIHGNHFYVLEKNGVSTPLNEQGRKDVVLIPARSGVKVITKYADFSDTTMPYMYHCHILSHEDNGMMGQFTVGPAAPIIITATTSDVSCLGGNDGSINLSLSGGVPPYTFQWSNGNTTQNITALSASIYNVTATDSYNSTVDDSISVSEPSVPFDIGNITGNTSPIDNTISGYFVVNDSQYTYQWLVTGGGGQIITGQGTYGVTIQWNGIGQDEITVIVSNGICSDTAMLSTQIISSVNDLNDFTKLILFPNANSRSFTLHIETPTEQEIQIEVVNVFGQKVSESLPEKRSGTSTKIIDLQEVSAGIYFVRVLLGDNLVTRKIVLQ